ncbi:MAG TPA: TerB family tellurite resistance protein [Kiloniellaceae bacterium]|nr:TerB family tellurite resistance protein [Kiloniellaceae bacterium]
MSLFQMLVQGLQLHGERLRNRKFLEASMAASALVAAADGEVSFSERAAVDSVLASVEGLQVFDVHDAVDLFSDFVAAIQEEPDAGRLRAMEAVTAVSDDSEAADLVVRIGCAISRADGKLTDREKTQVAEIAAGLGVSAPTDLSP